MSDSTTRTAAAPTAYTPPNTAEVLAEALGNIVAGRPLPEALRAPAAPAAAPATAEEGITRMLAGPDGARTA